MSTDDKKLDVMLFSLLSGEQEPPVEVDRALRRRIRSDESTSHVKLFSILIVVNAFMTLLSGTVIILFIPILILQVLAALHILLSLSALVALLIMGKKLFVFLEGVYSK
jgi:hypothetical protein